MFQDSWIGWKNLASKATVTGTNTSADFYPAALKNWLPWDYWQGEAGAGSAAFDCGVASAIDYLCLSGHNFSSAGGTYYFEGSNAADFSGADTLATFGVTNGAAGATYAGTYAGAGGATAFSTLVTRGNPVLAFALAGVTYRYYRLRYTGASTVVQLGVIAFGLKMTFEIGFYGGFTPPDWNEDVAITNTRSESGLFLGRTILRSGVKPISLTLEPVSHTWVDGTWTPFKEHATVLPFFFAWKDNPAKDSVFGLAGSWTSSKLRNKKYASVGLTFEGITR